MLCDKCRKNSATIFYRETINGREKNYALCTDCAETLEKSGEININGGFPEGIGEALFGGGMADSIFGSLFAPQGKTESEVIKKIKKCSICGATFADLVKEGKVGCPKCYETFSDELDRTITGIHGNTVHNGRAPAKLRGELDMKNKIKKLESELKESITGEDYEHAAVIRDEIKRLKGEL